jgi:electron transfer flavoprotein beta subunit
MLTRIVVLVKQVVDSEATPSAFRVDQSGLRVIPGPGVAQIVNAFDDNAVEAALQIKEALGDARVTVLSAGDSFAMDVIKKPLAMGADELVLLQDGALGDGIDPTLTVEALGAAIRKLGGADLVLAGRQASDWDHAQIPLGVAEVLGLPSITLARRVEVANGEVVVERVLADAYEVVTMQLPAVVTVSSELGQPRYPNLRGIMAAGRKQPTVWSLADIGIVPSEVVSAFELVGLAQPELTTVVTIVTGADDAEAGRNLALRLREARLI